MQQILLTIENGYMFHPRLASHRTKHIISPPGGDIKVFNPIYIHAVKLTGVYMGVTNIIGLKMLSNMHCSTGFAILQSEQFVYAHDNPTQFNNIMIKKIPTYATCYEILYEHFTANRRVSTTDIYVSVALPGQGSIIRIVPLLLEHETCTINELIKLHEVHSKMNIMYRYTFVNTTMRAVEWHSLFDSDVYIHIKRYFLHGNEDCHTYKKGVKVTYGPRINAVLKRLVPKAAGFNHHSAR
jgi:hypothetical protein